MTRGKQHYDDDLTRLLIRAGQGDAKAFERLHAALLPVVRDYLASLDGSIDYHRRQDLVQEVFFRMWSNLSCFRSESSAKTFVFAIAKNVFREELSRRRKLPTVPVSDLDGLVGAYVSDAATNRVGSGQAEFFEEIWQAVGQLPNVQREAFDLTHLQDMPMAEAAKGANCSIEQLRDRLYRARKQLRQMLRNLPRCILL